MAMAMTNEAFKGLLNAYHSLLAKPTLGMTAEDKQAHAELLHKLSQDILKIRTEGFSTVNELIKSQKVKIQEITENLSPAANDSAYSGLVEGISKGAEIIDSLIILAH